MSTNVKYKEEFLQYVHIIFYFSCENTDYNSFYVDFKKRETMQYFINSFMAWIRENYNLNITKQDVNNLYFWTSKYNLITFEKMPEHLLNKFIITKEIMEECMEFGLIPKVKYEINTRGINRVSIK